jgi:integrase
MVDEFSSASLYNCVTRFVGTFASRLAAGGASPITVAQMLGHSSTGIVMTLVESIDEMRRDAIRKLERFQAVTHTDPTGERG